MFNKFKHIVTYFFFPRFYSFFAIFSMVFERFLCSADIQGNISLHSIRDTSTDPSVLDRAAFLPHTISGFLSQTSSEIPLIQCDSTYSQGGLGTDLFILRTVSHVMTAQHLQMCCAHPSSQIPFHQFSTCILSRLCDQSRIFKKWAIIQLFLNPHILHTNMIYFNR